MNKIFRLTLLLCCFLGTQNAISHHHHSGDDTPGSLADVPGNHGMFMVGDKSLFLLHMPMFTNEKHMYQVILKAELSPEMMSYYRQLRAENPSKAYNLINVDNDKFTLPDLKSGQVTSFKATLFDGYSNDGGGTPGKILKNNIAVKVSKVVVFRHFNFSIDRPAALNFIIFGEGDEMHLSHYIARDPDFQQIITLSTDIDWLSEAQIESGVELSFAELPSMPTPCRSPLMNKTYTVQFQGNPDIGRSLDLTDSKQIWFSTGNLLNAKDPCVTDSKG
ncbi:hypothetical protein SIN8267_01127 [Sinobacterium norvegicum]|uniref:Secreted protein n=1 Tax=Sinobacterium norvegicum TaxID=1641715 RepID=A0ABN8EF43_9GAMM|nr:hypothetical protein [Sinobacterium norvegicum]CAH0991026.1 hypothetical protein SIN8267_01127 [Sinobacterium norvegicum]